MALRLPTLATPSWLFRSSISSLKRAQPRSTRRSHFTSSTSQPSSTVQIYHSTSPSPFTNLSIEHYLLQASHPSSAILFLYRNAPSVIIGRNQNPWLEVNLALLRQPLGSPRPQTVDLVRRRSGGGTVFHDFGNVNWSVIMPSSSFSRTKHAEMVISALGRLGVRGVRTNCRHDIVQDISPHHGKDGLEETYKVSGSAYKLTRLRSLHHGTCLLSSPNLGRIGKLLRSPAEGYVKARGVESVRSPIRNLDVGGEEFVDAVVKEFTHLYGGDGKVVEVGDDALEHEGVRKGFNELKSPEWIFDQTPQFTFSTFPSKDDPRERVPLPGDVPPGFRMSFAVRHGQIQDDACIAGLSYQETPDEISQDEVLSKTLIGRPLRQIEDWTEILRRGSPVPAEVEYVGKWLNGLFGLEEKPRSRV